MLFFQRVVTEITAEDHQIKSFWGPIKLNYKVANNS